MQKIVKGKLKNFIAQIAYRNEEREIEEILNQSEVRPIYFVHIRKTAGTSINFSFLNASNSDDVETFYESLASKINHRLIKGNKIFVGWNQNLINTGRYSYAFSHIPLHALQLPDNVYRFTCLRDPVKRVISHYNMLNYYRINGIDHPCMKVEGRWIGKSFDDFLNRIPPSHLKNQLFMFSKDYDVNEAINKIMALDKVLFTEDLSNGMASLSKELNWDLKLSRQKSFGIQTEISDEEMDKLNQLLAAEITMYNQLKMQLTARN